MLDVQPMRNKRPYDDLQGSIKNKVEKAMYDCNKKPTRQDGNRI